MEPIVVELKRIFARIKRLERVISDDETLIEAIKRTQNEIESRLKTTEAYA